jgi:hypothetical protein
MGFYYISILSVVPLSIAYGLLSLVLWGIARLTRGLAARGVLLVLIGVVFLVVPVAEELWIAWNFGQVCKEAGTFVYRKVQVEGFYDDTRPGRPGPLAEQAKKSMDQSGYLFHERPFESTRGGPSKVVRYEKVNDEWISRVLDRPTARYHYKWPNPQGVQVAYKVGKSERVVIDSENNEQIARYISFGRRPPWYWIALDKPAFACDAPGRWPMTLGNPLLYRESLIPLARGRDNHE